MRPAKAVCPKKPGISGIPQREQAKTLIRLRECTDWSESSLNAYVIRYRILYLWNSFSGKFQLIFIVSVFKQTICSGNKLKLKKTTKKQQQQKTEMSICVDLDETTHYEPPYLNLRCLQKKSLITESVKTI